MCVKDADDWDRDIRRGGDRDDGGMGRVKLGRYTLDVGRGRDGDGCWKLMRWMRWVVRGRLFRAVGLVARPLHKPA